MRGRILGFLAVLILLAGCGATKTAKTATSGHPTPEAVIRQLLANCQKDRNPCRLIAGKPVTAKESAKGVSPGKFFTEPSSHAPTTIFVGPVKPGQHLTRSQAHAALRELERLCREQHTSCGEAEAVFAEGHAHSKAASRPISKSALVELTE